MDYEELESNQRQHHNKITHQVKLETLEIENQYKRFSMLKPKIYKNGNQWFVCYGESTQDGIIGFGNTPHEAVMEWENNWNKQS